MNQESLLKRIDELADSPNAIRNLRKMILSLAASGRLVEQSQADTPAGELLKQIESKRAELVASKSIPKSKPLRANEVPTKELPAGWIWVQFGGVTFCRDGERVPLKKADRDSHKKNFDYYGASGVIDKVEKYLFDKPLLLIGEDGANLVNRSTPIAFMAEGKYWVNNHAHVLDAINRDVLEYLRIYINSISLEPYITGMAQPKMNQARMNSIPVPLPPLAEQKRIVAKVDQLMALCDRLEAQQQEREAKHTHLTRAALAHFHEQPSPANLNLLFHKSFTIPPADLRKTILQLAVQGKLVSQCSSEGSATPLVMKLRSAVADSGKTNRSKAKDMAKSRTFNRYQIPDEWEWAAFENIAKIASNLVKPQAFSDSLHLAPDNIEKETGRLLPCRTILDDGVKSPKHLFRKGQIVYSKIRPNLAKVVIAPFDGLCSADMYPIDCLIDAGFLLYYMLSEPFLRQAVRSDTRVAMPKINQTELNSIEVPVPPLPEQKRIVTKVESLMKQVDHMEAQLTQSRATTEKLMEAIVAQLSKSN